MSATVEAPAPPPAHPLPRAALYVGASVLLWLTQGLGMNFVAVNLAQIQGSLGATLTETNWLVAAYMAPNVSLAILLSRIRTQFGLRRFGEIAIAVFVASALLHLSVRDLGAALPVRFLAGAAASAVSSIGFLYMLEAFPPALRSRWGLSLALTCSAVMPTVARLISPLLLVDGSWRNLYLMEVGLALVALMIVWLLPLTPVPRARVLHRWDFVSYPLIALGFGLLAVVAAVGRAYWWLEAPWIGVCLAVAIVAIACAVAIERERPVPLLDIGWLSTPSVLHAMLALLVFRLLLAEQSAGAAGMFQTLGLLNEQARALYLCVLGASIAGGLVCGLILREDRVRALHVAALGCIAVGAFLDGHATNLTRPQDMLFSQSLIAFGGALFLPPAMMMGTASAMRRGPATMTTFIGIFLATQSLGGLAGSAAFGSFVTLREKFHSAHLVENLVMSDPVVAARVQQLGGAYGRVLTDAGLRGAEGVALLGQQATREANVLAYNDAFLLIAALAAAAMAWLLFLALLARLRARPVGTAPR